MLNIRPVAPKIGAEIWDNRCSIHCATGDYAVNERRTNWRSTRMEAGWKQREAKTA